MAEKAHKIAAAEFWAIEEHEYLLELVSKSNVSPQVLSKVRTKKSLHYGT